MLCKCLRKLERETGFEPATLALARQKYGRAHAQKEQLLPRNFHGAFRGSDKNHNLLKNGESAGIRTQDPRLKKALLEFQNTLNFSSFSRFRKIYGSQFRQQHIHNLHEPVVETAEKRHRRRRAAAPYGRERFLSQRRRNPSLRSSRLHPDCPPHTPTRPPLVRSRLLASLRNLLHACQACPRELAPPFLQLLKHPFFTAQKLLLDS